MNKKGVTTLEVLITGFIILVIGVLVYEGIVIAIKRHKEQKFFERVEEMNNPSDNKFPCDHGTLCNFKVHGEHMWCEFHKMYHHRDRACMHNAQLEKLEDELIRQREQELGIKKPPKPVKFEAEPTFGKRK